MFGHKQSIGVHYHNDYYAGVRQQALELYFSLPQGKPHNFQRSCSGAQQQLSRDELCVALKLVQQGVTPQEQLKHLNIFHLLKLSSDRKF